MEEVPLCGGMVKMFRKATNSSSFLLLVTFVIGCKTGSEGEDTGSTSTADNTSMPTGDGGGGEGDNEGTLHRPARVECNDPSGTVLCWKELNCGFDPFNNVNNPAQVCSAYFYGAHDITHSDEFPNAQYDGTCTEIEDAADGEPPGSLLPCVCDYGYGIDAYWGPPEWDPMGPVEIACDPDGAGAGDTGGSPTTGDSTAGDSTAGGLDTDGPEVEAWVCSLKSDENCQGSSGFVVGRRPARVFRASIR